MRRCTIGRQEALDEDGQAGRQRVEEQAKPACRTALTLSLASQAMLLLGAIFKDAKSPTKLQHKAHDVTMGHACTGQTAVQDLS